MHYGLVAPVYLIMYFLFVSFQFDTLRLRPIWYSWPVLFPEGRSYLNKKNWCRWLSVSPVCISSSTATILIFLFGLHIGNLAMENHWQDQKGIIVVRKKIKKAFHCPLLFTSLNSLYKYHYFSVMLKLFSLFCICWRQAQWLPPIIWIHSLNAVFTWKDFFCSVLNTQSECSFLNK